MILTPYRYYPTWLMANNYERIATLNAEGLPIADAKHFFTEVKL